MTQQERQKAFKDMVIRIKTHSLEKQIDQAATRNEVARLQKLMENYQPYKICIFISMMVKILRIDDITKTKLFINKNWHLYISQEGRL